MNALYGDINYVEDRKEAREIIKNIVTQLAKKMNENIKNIKIEHPIIKFKKFNGRNKVTCTPENCSLQLPCFYIVFMSYIGNYYVFRYGYVGNIENFYNKCTRIYRQFDLVYVEGYETTFVTHKKKDKVYTDIEKNYVMNKFKRMLREKEVFTTTFELDNCHEINILALENVNEIYSIINILSDLIGQYDCRIIRYLKQQIINLSKYKNTSKSNIKGGNIATATKQIKQLKLKSDTGGKKLDELKKDLYNLQTENEQLTKKINSMENYIKKLEDRIEND